MRSKHVSAIFIAAVFAWFVGGCQKSNTPSTPGPKDNSIKIMASITIENNKGLLGEIFSAYVCDSAGQTLTTAAISIIGQGGIIGTPGTDGTFYRLTLGSTPDVYYNAQYAVSVTYNAQNFYGVFDNYYGMTVDSLGDYVAWPYEPIGLTVTVQDPSAGMHYYYPTTSPFFIAPTGVYGNGSGNYTVGAEAAHVMPVTFTGQTGVSATLVVKDVRYLVVAK